MEAVALPVEMFRPSLALMVASDRQNTPTLLVQASTETTFVETIMLLLDGVPIRVIKRD